jgi:hypothetical protein
MQSLRGGVPNIPLPAIPSRHLAVSSRAQKSATPRTQGKTEMRQKCFISIRGREHEWTFDVEVDPKHLPEIQADGIEIHQIEYTVPTSVMTSGLAPLWMFLYDCFHLRNPFRQ